MAKSRKSVLQSNGLSSININNMKKNEKENSMDKLFTLDGNKVSLIAGSAAAVALDSRDWNGAHEAVSAFVDLFKKETYLIPTPALHLYNAVEKIFGKYFNGRVGYVDSTYANNAVIEHEGHQLPIKFNALPKEGWAEVTNSFGILSVDLRKVYMPCKDQRSTNTFLKHMFVKAFSEGVSFTFPAGPRMINYVAQMLAVWNAETPDLARKMSYDRLNARVEKDREYKMAVAEKQKIDLTDPATIADAAFTKKLFPTGEDVNLRTLPAGTRLDLFATNEESSYRYPIYWTGDMSMNLANLRSVPAPYFYKIVLRTVTQ